MILGRIFSACCLMASAMSLVFGDESSQWTAIVPCYYSSPYVTIPISFPSDVPGSPISGGRFPWFVAITPDATRALVTNEFDNNVSVLDLTRSPIALSETVDIGNNVAGVAITPDGTQALLTTLGTATICRLDLTQSPIAVIDSIPLGSNPWSIAITPDGTQALVTDTASNHITLLDLTQSPMAITTTVDIESGSYGVAITPNGTRALATNYSSALINVIDLTQSPIAVIGDTPVGTCPSCIAISPDGTQAVVGNFLTNNVTILDLTQWPITAIDTVENVGMPMGITVTPDGTRALVTSSESATVNVIDLTHFPTGIIDTIAVQPGPWGIAITPDQAPTSSFTTSVSGLTVTCDGSGSSSPMGGIKIYRWDFGDRTSEETSLPVTSHDYATGGTYTIALTVVNDGGTSTEIIFTGQTMSNHGLPQAQSSQHVNIAPLNPDAPSQCTGKVHLSHKHKKVYLTTKWSKSSSANVLFYEIFAHSRLRAKIPGSEKPRTTLRLHPKYFPHHVTKKFRLRLNEKYRIRAVTASGRTSPYTAIVVRH